MIEVIKEIMNILQNYNFSLKETRNFREFYCFFTDYSQITEKTGKL